jgi:serine/threonine protein kinase
MTKLVCFSKKPKLFVLKYYRYGTLKAFVFPDELSATYSYLEYSLNNIYHHAEKLAWGFNFMNSKKVIHNDIKLDNILLDGDEAEPLCPVITDFGICKILDTADVVSWFKICEIRAFTCRYAAPEVIYSFFKKPENRASDFKIDVYLFGVFTRKRLCEKFEPRRVMKGKIPYLIHI